MYRCILFDLDGTLTDSGPGIVNCARYAIEKLGDVPPPDQFLLQFVGPPLQNSFQDLCGYGPEKTAEAIRVFRERYGPKGQYENTPAEGMAGLLANLKAEGRTVALASSKREDMCLSVCQRFGFAPYLDVIAGSPPLGDWSKADVIREALRRLEITDPSSVLMVGDRKYDVLGARECGISCVGVSFFGYALPGELEEAGAIAIVDSAAALEKFLLEH